MRKDINGFQKGGKAMRNRATDKDDKIVTFPDKGLGAGSVTPDMVEDIDEVFDDLENVNDDVSDWYAEPDLNLSNEELYGGSLKRDNETNTVQYSGVLGDFTFNPDEFSLKLVKVKDESGKPTGEVTPALIYIGDETDGSKIHIPEGITDSSYMFMDNKTLERVPPLPSSINCAVAMFKGCSDLKTMTYRYLPEGLEEGQFMFSDCSSLQEGPIEMSSKMEDATAMFYNCSSLINTPVLNDGLKCTDSMFVNCKSLVKKPKIPESVEFADYMTVGCEGLDTSQQSKKMDDFEKRQTQFDKENERKTVNERIGSVFSAVMQYHYMKKEGATFTEAFRRVYDGRKSGNLKSQMSTGWEKVYNKHKDGPFGLALGYLLYSSKRTEAKRQTLREDRRREFEDLNRVYKGTSAGDIDAYRNGVKDASAKKFERIGSTTYVRGGKDYGALVAQMGNLEMLMEKSMENGRLSETDRNRFAHACIELMSHQQSYYKGVKSKFEGNELALEGLDRMNNAHMDAVLSRVQKWQDKYHLMNEREIDTMVACTRDTGYGAKMKTEGKQADIEKMKAVFYQHGKDVHDQVNQLKTSNMKVGYRERRGLEPKEEPEVKAESKLKSKSEFDEKMESRVEQILNAFDFMRENVNKVLDHDFSL